MNPTSAAEVILAGWCAVFVGLFNKRFYWRKGWSSGDKQTPRWVGRLLFIGIGALFILVGLRFFIFGY